MKFDRNIGVISPWDMETQLQTNKFTSYQQDKDTNISFAYCIV